MNWLRAHAPLALISVAAVLMLLGSFAATRTQLSGTATAAYRNLPGNTLPIKDAPDYDTEILDGNAQTPAAQTDGGPFGYSYIRPFSSSAPISEAGASTNSATVPASGATTPQPTSAQAEPAGTTINSLFNDAYSLLPRGLISTAIPKQKVRTSEEQTLYDYGNAVGAHIKSFESSHKDSTALKNFFPEKGGFSSGDATAVGAVLALGNDYSQLGATIANMSSVPPEALTLHAALAKSYGEVGSGLALLAKTPVGGDITKEILAYDSIADAFIKNFVALAEFFSVRGIKFSASDPGNVFSFSATGGL